MKDAVLFLMSVWRSIRRYVIKVMIFLIAISFSLIANAKEPSISFLSLSDIHFDPFVACYAVKEKPCPLLVKLQAAPVDAWPSILQKEDTKKPAFGYDTNYPLLLKALSDAKTVAKEDQVDFVWVLGDFLGHHFRSHYRKYSLDASYAGYYTFQLKTLAFVTHMLLASFPDKDVYPVLGNNDTLVGDYQLQPNGKALRDIATLWAPLIHSAKNHDAFLRYFPKAGYYEVTPTAMPDISIFALDSVIFSPKSRGKNVDAASTQELDWLQSRLSAAKASHHKVFLAMHIPMSIDVYFTSHFRLFTFFYLWRTEVVKAYQALITENASIIAGIFSGHIHSTWFQWWDLGEDRTMALAGTGSISPVFGNQPSFNVYTYYPEDDDVTEVVHRLG